MLQRPIPEHLKKSLYVVLLLLSSKMICKTLGGVSKNKKVMRFETRMGPKKKKKKKKKSFVGCKVYISSCYFFVTPFPLHFKDDF
jgi:hypothetical protein